MNGTGPIHVWHPSGRSPESDLSRLFLLECQFGEPIVDKKAKKKIQTLNQRIQKLRQQLAGARKQVDDQDELAALEKQIADAEAEATRLRES